METLKKVWTASSPVAKKYLARHMTYRLNQLIDNRNYEVVFEASLSLNNPNEPDIVVYKRDVMAAIMAIEICRKEDLTNTISIASEIVKNEKCLEAFFIYETDGNDWYSLSRENNNVSFAPNSLFGNLNLKHLLIDRDVAVA